jgi:hypothetical protein
VHNGQPCGAMHLTAMLPFRLESAARCDDTSLQEDIQYSFFFFSHFVFIACLTLQSDSESFLINRADSKSIRLSHLKGCPGGPLIS